MSAFTHQLGQVTYPRMERQDLTQGQLGSFKFTPTDEVHHVFAFPSPTPSHQLTSSIVRDYLRSDLPADLFTADVKTTSAPFRPLQPAGSPTRINTACFDTHIRPSFVNTHFRQGSNTSRGALDPVSTSPKRNFINPEVNQPASRKAIQSNMAQSNNNQLNTIPNYDLASALNPTVPEFNINDVNLLHTSLIRALAAEQQAHKLTKEALLSEQDMRYKAEAEAQKYLEHNRSLIGSVNMLKSIVQHNVKKEQAAAQQAAVGETECARFYQAAESRSQQQTLLHDAVKNLRAPVSPAKPTLQQPAGSDHLFNIDLVATQGSLALRRHFSSSEHEKELGPNKIVRSDENESPIAASVEGPERREKSDETCTSGEATAGVDLQEVYRDTEPVVLQHASNNIPKSTARKKAKTMLMPFDAHVQWNLDVIFDDKNDKLRRLRDHSSLFSQHPVRYLPNKSDKNLYRTVMMDFIPNGATCKDILGTIRGGAVESIQLVGPIGLSTDFMTARVVFNYELGARNVYMRGQNPGIKIREQRVRVWQVLEATYPRDEELERAIFEDGCTRFLLIENAIEASLDKLPDKLAEQLKDGLIIGIGKAVDGLPMIEFTSVAECLRALNQLLSDRDFGGSRFDFEEDPCNDPY